ncbi:MAG: sulfatase-like hydrolase/transferase [Prosthecobacter sp.]|uniref:sulfatase-like hydrolase/transferase n=1 Tax=Prosthecobacter sp. TaxID=1965333 RepID=UPI0025D62E7B|nr:sulfatase-like hydrolase/transferase [Prosthecobacter sp.]MCF7787691.1 sulfatase-like hydrolase/transferase [Prosthecobacter sp.]
MKTLIASGICLLLAASAFAKGPNILFILADDQSWSGTSVRMMPNEPGSASREFHTPNLEKLAAQGMTFSQAYAAHCKCECSRAAIQMGRTTTTLNAPDKNARNWSAPVTDSLVNTLKKADPSYLAAHFGKWQWFHTPESMGYDASDGITINEDGDTTDPEDPKQSFSITRRAGAFMESAVKEGHPFFIQLSYYAVHQKPQALAATLKKYEGMDSAAKGGRGDRAVMAAMTEDLDTCVGEVLKKIDDLRIAENTIVIYTSDNGARTTLLNGGKGDLGEGGIREPLIIRGPGIKAGSHCTTPVILYDLMPTVADFASPGFAIPKGVEGGSWKPLLLSAGSAPVKRPIGRFVWHQAVEVEHPQSAIREGDYKLLYFWDTKEGLLFDVVNDLGETRDLAKQKPDLAARLLAELKAHIRAGLGEQASAALERGEFPQGRGPGKGKGPRGGKKKMMK